ncbi:hypothetical protein MMC14_000985 [Varicellaria rhodocarpa]|nr:hypothetical protein [Varicellaria rhodocarpa]
MPSPEVVRLARALSSTLAWSLSFYPQPILNIRRKSTTGSTVDFPTINVLGFLCYAVSTSLLLYSPLIRAQYAARNSISPEPAVRGNDLAFAVHAVAISGITWSMYWQRLWGFEQRKGQKISQGIIVVGVVCLLGICLAIIEVWVKGGDGGRNPNGWAWIDVVYTLGYAKLFITLVKYIPQVRTNYLRNSTVGWSIWQIWLDFTGGILSVAQLVIDSSLQKDWSGLTGNPVKLGLGNVSMFFDAIFFIQHYWLYKREQKFKDVQASDAESQNLIPSEEEDLATRCDQHASEQD